MLLCPRIGRDERAMHGGRRCLAVGAGVQDHEVLETWAERDSAVGQMATAEHLSSGISYRRCRRLLCSPAAAPCQLPSLHVVLSQANLPSFLLSSWDFFSSVFGENNA